MLEILDTDGITVLATDESLGDFDDPATMVEIASDGVYFVAVRDLSGSEGGSTYHYVLISHRALEAGWSLSLDGRGMCRAAATVAIAVTSVA